MKDDFWSQIDDAVLQGSMQGAVSVSMEGEDRVRVSWHDNCATCGQVVSIDLVFGSNLLEQLRAWRQWADEARVVIAMLGFAAITGMGLSLWLLWRLAHATTP